MCLTETIISDALDKLRGAVTIVYPMNLPPYDVIRQEFEGIEDLSGTQVNCSMYICIIYVCYMESVTGLLGSRYCWWVG